MYNLAITDEELRINGFLSATEPEMSDFSSIPVTDPEILYFRIGSKVLVRIIQANLGS